MEASLYMDKTIMPEMGNAPSLQRRIARLLKDADQLFSLGDIRMCCQLAVKEYYSKIEPSPFANYGAQLFRNREYHFALTLTLTYTSTMDRIVQWAKGCIKEYLLQEVMEERERRIEDFARMKIASRWYQIKNDDHTWRVFSQNIPFGDASREEEIRLFFERLDEICILTDILNGHASVYGIEVDYTTAPKADTNKSVAPKAAKAPKPRETMTLKRKGCLTEGHLTLLYMKLCKEGWIDGNEADFKALFSGKRDEDCQLTWKEPYGRGTLFELFRQIINAELAEVADGYTLSAILEGHFKDPQGQWLTSMDKGNNPNSKAMPVILECIKMLKASPQQILEGSWGEDEDFASIYDPYDHQDLQLHKR